ncbi:MAG: malate synthase [Desulfobulbaceae bacterium]|nr:malate synthase [Desulfobulbaceae bacterium]
MSESTTKRLLYPNELLETYPDVLDTEALNALEKLVPLNEERNSLMEKRNLRRKQRFENQERITFLDNDEIIAGTDIAVADARAGNFIGPTIPADLQRQWIQGTGPGAKPRASIDSSIRNVAHALLSGADGWMFDGEDALGQVQTMSLDNLRNLKLAFQNDPLFLTVAETVSHEMNRWAESFLGRTIIDDWKEQLQVTTKIFRPRALHLDDRHFRDENGGGLSASIVDTTLYISNNHGELQKNGSSLVLYLPKIQTAEEAAFWKKLLDTLESVLGLQPNSILAYVLLEQVEATFQIMEIRAALGGHFVGFNTGRWDYINSVADAMAWDSTFINPNIEAITMTYGHMRNYEDRVRRCVNTPDNNENCALFQGGMEPNIPVGSEEGVEASMKNALAGAEREQKAGASGKWVAHWKMVHIIRPVWEKVGENNQLGRSFPELGYAQKDADALFLLEDAPRTIRGARNLLSVALQYGNAFAQGFQAAALKPGDFFGNDDILYLMEDMATGEIRMSILWEWVHKGGVMTEDDLETEIKKGQLFTKEIFERLLEEEYEKLQKAESRDVHEESKTTSLPIIYEMVKDYINEKVKIPWYIDLLNLNLNNDDLGEGKRRIAAYLQEFRETGQRITERLDHTR